MLQHQVPDKCTACGVQSVGSWLLQKPGNVCPLLINLLDEMIMQMQFSVSMAVGGSCEGIKSLESSFPILRPLHKV